MIRIDLEQTIEGVTVYRDEDQADQFVVLPNQPRFRLDDSGKPVFKFIKYRMPLDRPGGVKGGGFVIFDSEFVVPDDKMKKVQAALDDLVTHAGLPGPAKIGDFTYTRGAASLVLLDSGGALVEKIMSAEKPSLYGHNVCSFTAELSPEGAAVIEACMQGAGGVAQIHYDLYFMTKIPKISGHVWFSAEKFYSYYQQIDKSDDHWWNGNDGELKDKRRETFTSSDSGGVEFHFDWTLPDPDQDAKLKNKIRDWGWSSLEDAVKRLTLSDPTANTETGLPDGVHHVTRDFSTDKTASFDRYMSESDAVEWHVLPQGTLPNITTIPGVKWKDYSVVVDADDPFFKTLNVNVGVNADFKKFGINSVDVHLAYKEGNTQAATDPDFHLTSCDQRSTFQTYIENGNWKFKYAYRVNFLGDDRVFDSGLLETDRTALTINVGEMGVLSVEVIAGGINWDQVTSAEVNLSYEDPSANVDRIEKRFVLTKADPSDHWLQVIMARRDKPYGYSVKYTMASGQIYTVTGQQSDAPELYVDDPFYTKVVGLRSMGDFSKDIDTIFLDLRFDDPANGYTQTRSVALTKNTPFLDWTFPVLQGSKGKVTYSGKIKYQGSPPTEDEIAVTPAASDTIYVADTASLLVVNVEPSLIDWSKVKLVTLDLHYVDAKNAIDSATSVAIKSGVTPGAWQVKLKDRTAKSFTWGATYFLADGTQRTASATTDKTLLVLELPPG